MLFFKKKKAEPKRPLGLYIHIPFCVQKCKYCDFLSAPADDAVKKRYADALCKEIAGYKELTKEYELATIYFGGGTPSVLDVSLIEQILDAVKRSFFVDMAAAEVTLEVNPGTASFEKLKRYKELGINRLSIGVQSAKDNELAVLGRIHSFEDAKKTVLWARDAGFDNISLDLMSALPGQSLEDYKENVEEILALNPEHISSYSLIVEEGTPFYSQYAEGMPKESELPDEETDRTMYAYTKERLAQAGYHRYEISNYAKPGYESRHNSSYWIGTEYLGIGLGASSLFTNARYHNETDLLTYMEEAEAGKDVRREIERLVQEEQMEEFMILGLRMMCGISRAEFQKRFGKPIETVYGSAIKKLERQGLLVIQGDVIALTDAGIDVSNQVFVEFVPEEFVRR
ncbi:MAG: oxygen-independent coproporphyrinogen III oxidase [Lachnospiraceae bacterium]|nr:oxygen-independent coproporphyrinogen III oxidase [Lachnospiraceae bacterium]MBP3577985.1 oxygen-independent coproporphyrinogen III oxidase [Lachnospiraceae bacterium]